MYKVKLKHIKETLILEFKNLNKSKNRPRSDKNIKDKRQKLYDLLLEYKTTLSKLEYKLTIDKWNEEIANYNELKKIYYNSIQILDETEVLKSKRPTLKAVAKTAIFCKRLSIKTTIMPTVDIKLGTTLVTHYDGSPGNLYAFLDSVELFKSTVSTAFTEATVEQKAEANATLLLFIKARLTGRARQIINGANSLNAVLQKLKDQCSPKATSDSLRAKLKTAKQKTDLTKFCEEVEELTSQLASQYIDETIPAIKANQMATKAGIETLISGITNPEARIILKAGNFNTISEATQKLQEGDYENKSQANIFYARGNQPQRGRGRGRFNGGRNYYNNRQSNRWQNQGYGNHQNQGYGNHQQQQNYNRQNNQQQQNRFPNQRGRGNRGGWQGGTRYPYQQQPQQMYFTQAEQPQMQMQQQQIQQQPQQQQMQQPPTQQQPPQPNMNNQANFLGGQYG